MSDPSPASGGVDYVKVQASEEFRGLRSKHRRFVFPIAIVSLLWYFVYVILAAFWPGIMGASVFGYTNVGLVLGLGQFVTTFLVTWAYVSYANRKLDPITEQLRAELAVADAAGGRS